MGSYLFFLLILACPLAMIFMMRGKRGGYGGDADRGHTPGSSLRHGDTTTSLEELHRKRGDLDREIEEREAEEQASSVGSGPR